MKASLSLLVAMGALFSVGCGSGRDDAFYERQAAVMAAEAEGTQLQPAGNERGEYDASPAAEESNVETIP